MLGIFILMNVQNPRWSTRELERRINSMLFEQLAASKDKAKVKVLAEKGQIIQTPNDTIKDPYIFEFLGWPEQHIQLPRAKPRDGVKYYI